MPSLLWSRIARTAVVVAAPLLATACGAAPPLHDVPPSPPVPPLSAAQREAVGVMALGRVTHSADLGASLGGYRVDSFCAGPISGVAARVSDTDIAARFRASFARVMGDRLGFRVADASDDLFRRVSAGAKAEFLVAARIENLRLSLCRQVNLIGRQIGLSGEATARIVWQMLDQKTDRLVYDGETLARGEQASPALVRIEDVLLNRLFEDALVRLAADNRFRRAVVSGVPRADALRRTEVSTGPWGTGPGPQPGVSPAAWSPGAAAASGLLTLTGPAPYTRPFAVNAERIRAATVTVLGMQGHGSGFFVSPDGWALTNAHVVDQGDVVRVRLVDGRELWARVARRHPIRDVALLRVVGQGLAAVPIRPTLARVSETTYAVGTPVDRDLGQTVSQGIISAWRPGDRHGMDVYQATTPIHSGNSGGPLVDAWGNVVAITVSTIRGGGAMGSSLSFFIPVHDALRHLGVVIQPAPAAPQPPAFMPHPMPPAMASPMVPSMGLPMTTPMPPGFGGMTAHPGPAATPPWSAPGTRRGAPSISTPPPLDPRVAPVDAPASLSIPPPPGGAPLEAPPPPAATVPDRVTPGRVPLL